MSSCPTFPFQEIYVQKLLQACDCPCFGLNMKMILLSVIFLGNSEHSICLRVNVVFVFVGDQSRLGYVGVRCSSLLLFSVSFLCSPVLKSFSWACLFSITASFNFIIISCHALCFILCVCRLTWPVSRS